MVDPAAATERALAKVGLKPIAQVHESARATDFVIAAHSSFCVLRCVGTATPADHRALATMLAEGDFTRAFIVYTAEDEPPLSGEIESYPLSRIDDLAALLAKESPP